MSLYPDPLEAVVESIETLNPGVQLAVNEYNFDPSTAIPEEASGVNTQIHISAKGASTPYAGAVDIKHIRLKLSDLTTLIPSEIAVSNITTTFDLALAINKFYGTNFTTADIVTSDAGLVDGAGDVTLVAKPTSRGWIGQVTFHVTKGRIPLTDVITVTRLPGLNYPDPYEAKPFGIAYTYWRDYSLQYAILDVLQTGAQGDLEAVKDAMVNTTGDAWVTTGSSRYSLEGAEILYVGDTSGYPEFNQNYEKGVVVKLSAACLGYSGRLFLHYNLPEVL
jgi:hypothetical protein